MPNRTGKTEKARYGQAESARVRTQLERRLWNEFVETGSPITFLMMAAERERTLAP